MKVICEICKIPFEDEELIDLRADQYYELTNVDDWFMSDIRFFYVCEACYAKHSEIQKEILKKKYEGDA